jgi:glutamate/tyrosine decarboxylase-like PLP-dependent enzyme
MSLKEHGVKKYSRLIQQNIDQANYLAELVKAAPELELSAPVGLSVVCFRYITPDIQERQLDELNKQIEIELQERGVAIISGTTINGRKVLRLAVTNHRSRREDFDLLVGEIIRIGKELRR